MSAKIKMTLSFFGYNDDINSVGASLVTRI